MTSNAGHISSTHAAPRHACCGTAGDVDVRLSRPAERDAILRFIEETGFNPRAPQTWDGLGMLAMTAWNGSRLVGAIPLEPRWWQLRPGWVVSTVHQTTVGVLPEFQGRGIGSLMQDAICAHQPPLAAIATVFREDETSLAYRWYLRNGFEPATRVSAWLLDQPRHTRLSTEIEVLDPGDPAIDWTAIDALWRSACVDRYGGFVCRERRPLRDWLHVHPYRNRYSFHVLLVRDAGNLVAYAVLGIGQLHSKTTRVEIMEHATRKESPDLVDELCRATLAFTRAHDYRPVRWALAAGDPDAIIARRHGFERDWEFDLLWRPLPSCAVTLPDVMERTRLWRYHSLDYA
ncbi:MAG: GNAT family N-acetyltransferase [Planctomycetes bacterium]|nr:GNAT family N-acetyltransferase [Planctomycetota bacterium]